MSVIERMEKVYEDSDIELYRGLDEREAERLIEDLLLQKPMTFNEIKRALAVAVSDERIRRILRRLIERKRVAYDPRTREYYFAGVFND